MDDEEDVTEEDRRFCVPDEQATDVEEDQNGILHRLVDRSHSAEESSSIPFVRPYFPLAFALSKDRPLAFNFDLWLLDGLTLPCPILARDENIDATLQGAAGEKVSFGSVREAVDYCRGKLAEGWSVSQRKEAEAEEGSSGHRDGKGGEGSSIRARKSQGHSHPDLKKEAMFRTEGKALETVLTSGREDLDANLSRVRLDR